jgi:toxin CcdB
MAQFDVYRMEGRAILLVDCQNNYLSHLTTRFVIPLIHVGSNPPNASRLNPVFEVDGQSFVLSPNAAATVPLRQLGNRITSLSGEQDVIKAAIDQLVTGF